MNEETNELVHSWNQFIDDFMSGLEIKTAKNGLDKDEVFAAFRKVVGLCNGLIRELAECYGSDADMKRYEEGSQELERKLEQLRQTFEQRS